MCAMVGAVVPDREMADLIGVVARELGEEVPCIETSAEGLVGALRMMEPHGVKVLLSSGRLAELIKTATTVPVVTCNPSSYDLLLALARAKALSSKIALLHFGGLPLDIAEIEDALGVKIGEFVSGRSAQDVRNCVEQIKNAGYNVVVSGLAPSSIARGYGLLAVVIRAGKVTVTECLQAAINMVKTHESTDERALAALAAVESIGFGLLVVDKNGRILLMNTPAREISGVPIAEQAAEVIGQGAWERLLSQGPVSSAVFGPGRAIVEARVAPRATDLRTLAILDPPLLRRLLAQVSEEDAHPTLLSTFSDLVATSLTMGSVLARAADLARREEHAIIYGEPGVGKHTLAQAIHSASRRARAPFIRLNGMLPCETIMADIVGRQLGTDEASMLERAHGGTVYVHECWNLSLDAQRVLLEVLERKAIRRADGSRGPCDVRMILGSTRPLREMVESGRILRELYSLCGSAIIRIPPLRERQEDIVPMLCEFLKREGVPEPAVLPALQRRLLSYRWPNNCHDLKNFASRLASLYRAFPSAARSALEKTAFEEMESESETRVHPEEEVLVLKPGSMEYLEEQIIEQMDKLVGGNKSELARRLGISRSTLWKKLKLSLEKSGTE